MNRFLAAVVAVTALLRFTGLGAESLWYDEAVSLFNAQAPLLAVPREVIARDVSPPLYFLVLAVWTRIFGVGEASARALSALGSTLALVFFYRVARRVAGERVARLAAVLYAFAPLSLRLAQEARMYGLLLPLTWLAFDLLAVECERDEPRFGRVALVHLSLLYTHAFGAFVPLISLAAVLYRRGPRVAGRLAAWLVPVGLAFLPWARVMAAQARERAGGFWIGVPDLSSIHYLVYVMAGGGPDAAGVPLVLAASRLAARVAYVLIGVSLVTGRRAAWAAFAAFWSPVAAVFVVSHLGQSLFVDRYFALLAPCFWLSLALGLAAVPGRGAWLALAGWLVLTAPMVRDHYARPHKAQWREAVRFASESGVRPDTIVDTGGMMVLIAYLPPPRPPQQSTIGAGFPPSELPAPELARRLASVNTCWVFYSSHAKDPQSYRAAVRASFDEVAYRELTGIAVGCYRRRRTHEP